MSEELAIVDYIKHRTSDAGKSPIGSLAIFKEYVEWRDSCSPNRHKISLGDIKVLKVSLPHKSKVQLQICLQDGGQSTFVFLRPNSTREEQTKDRDAFKETLQQAIVAHRQRESRVQQKISTEKESISGENEEKKKMLKEDKRLNALYNYLVRSKKLLSDHEFWTDRYKKSCSSEDQRGITGAFLSNILQWDVDTNGLKLNLNPSLVRNIFDVYPMVHRKHLELVPHEMTEEEFWVKFASSHYFHRERDVLPNPDDSFADCVKADEEEIAKLVSGGAKRKRLNFDYLSDNVVSEINRAQRIDSTTAVNSKEKQRATLIRRCNFLSEQILQLTSAATAADSTTEYIIESGRGDSSSLFGSAEDALESAELAEEETEPQLQPIKVADGTSLVDSEFTPDEATRFRSIVCDFIDDVKVEDILDPSDGWLGSASSSSSSNNNGAPLPLDPATQWGPLTPYVDEILLVLDAVNELSHHFWSCFSRPPLTAEVEKKIDRMEQTLKKYEDTEIAEAEHRFGVEAFLHTREMIRRVHERYALYLVRKKGK